MFESALNRPIEYAQPTPSPPAAEPTYPLVQLGTLAYLQYAAELANRAGFNAFDVTRFYINITGDLARRIKFRVTPDLKRLTDGSLSGSLAFRLKYGFVEFDDLTPRSWLRFGLHQTPWLDFEESINRYRVQGTMFAEREGLIPGSADFGVGYLVRFPGNAGEAQVGIYNGEGFTQAEATKHKSLQGRVTIAPFHRRPIGKGLRVSGFYTRGWFDTGRPRHLGIVMASFEHTKLVATLQGLWATERPTGHLTRNLARRGASGFVELRQGLEGWAVVARIDRFDPDRQVARDSTLRTIFGVAYWLLWSKVRLGFVATDEAVRYEAARERPTEHRLLVQTHLQF